MTSQTIYTIGGNVRAGGGVYITRQADMDLLALCRRGTFAYILTARQMGKSSLMVHTAEQLASEKITSVIIDLNEIGTMVTVEQWYMGLLDSIDSELNLRTEIIDWWQNHTHLSEAYRLALFFRDVLLTEISGSVVIFIDEIDATLDLDFTDDFFAVIRSVYDARSRVPEFNRLSIVLIGVATPSELISESKRTPFNIGQRVELTDFTFPEARPLSAGLALPRGQALQVLAWVLKWTGGQPYLTQRLCLAIASNVADHHQSYWSETDINRIIERVFFGDLESRDGHLQFVRVMLTERAPDLAQVLSTYRAIRSGLYPVPDEERSPIISHLKLSGIVRSVKGMLQVRNPIYAKVFDIDWINDIEERGQYADPRELSRLRALAEAQESQVESQRRRAEAERRQAEEERRRATAERKRAEAERLRAEEQARAAVKLRQRAVLLSGALTLTMIAVIIAILLGVQAQSNARTAQNAATQEALARGTAVAALNAEQVRATQEALARQEADANLATAQVRATQEAQARETAVAALSAEQIQATQEAQARQTAEAGATQEALARENAVIAQSTAEFQATLEAMAKATAQSESTRSLNAEATARAEATRADEARDDAEREADRARDAEAEAEAERATAQAESTRAIQAEQTAEAERTTAQAEATRAIEAEQTAQAERATAEAERDRARLAISRQLATQALDFINTDLGLALLLSLEANHIADTPESRDSLRVSLQSVPRLTTLDRTDSGHTDNALSVTFSPDGKTLASGGADDTIILWDVSDRINPQRLGTLPSDPNATNGHTDNVLTLAFSPDGHTLASGSDDQTIILWNVESPNNPAYLDTLTDTNMRNVRSVAFSPDGTILASGSDDSIVRLWNVIAPNEPPTRYPGHEVPVQSVAFSPDGKTLATGSTWFDNNTIILWTVTGSGNLTQTEIISVNSAVLSVAFSPDENEITLASGSTDNTVTLRDITNLQVSKVITANNNVWSVAFGHNGNTVASGLTTDPNDPDETVILWDVEDWRNGSSPKRLSSRMLTDHVESVRSVAFSPDQKTLASASDDDKIILWEIDRNNLHPPATDPNDDFMSWKAKACDIVGRNMTLDEIKQFKLEDILEDILEEAGNTGPCAGPFPALATNSEPLSAPPPTSILPPTAKAIPTSSPTLMAIETATPTLTPSATLDPSVTPSVTQTPSPTPIPSLTFTLTPTPSSTQTLTPNTEPSITATLNPTPTLSATPTPTPTAS